MDLVINMNKSYWQKTTQRKKEKSIQQDLKADIVIIGGGLAGVSLAYQFKDTNLKVIVLEKDQLGSHTSGHTTAKVTVLHDLIYKKIVDHYDIHQAYLYYKSNEQALQEITDIIEKEKIDCDYQENTSFIYTDDPQYVKDIKQQQAIFQSLRVPYIEDKKYLASIGLEHQAIFHPLKYLYALVDICQKHDIDFYENSEVVHIQRKEESFLLKVNEHQIECQYLIHATRYPFIKKGLYFMKLFQEREFIDLKHFKKDNNSYLCVDSIYSYRPTQQHSLEIKKDASDWYAQDSIPLRGIPYIGKLNRYDEEYIVYGFQKWGMTLSQVSAKLIADLILERDNPYEELYSCQYFSISCAKEYIPKIMNNVKRGYLSHRYQTVPLKSLEKNQGGLVKENHSIYAVYCDDKGKYHYFSPYCPHLKCVIQFNEKTQTWDCPCHQSVYDAYGNVIEGPSLYSLPIKKD